MAKHLIKIEPPSLADNTALVDRVQKALTAVCPGRLSFPLPVAKILASKLNDPLLTASVVDKQNQRVIVGLESGNAMSEPVPASWTRRVRLLPPSPADQHSELFEKSGYGVALDLGSTTLEAELLDLAGGQVLARQRMLNPQADFSSDILGRIHGAASPEIARNLHLLLRDAVALMLKNMCRQAGVKEVKLMVAAGNTTMTHFFLNLNTQTLYREPYVPVVNQPAPCYLGHLGFKDFPRAVLWALPNVGAYFGGDLIAGIIAANMFADRDVNLLVDVGTNAEVVLGNAHWLLACAGAAGPALEGGVAGRGLAAGPGAVQGVVLDEQGEPLLNIINNEDGSPAQPIGLCGSGLLQLMAQLYLRGFIDWRAKFIEQDHHRLRATENGWAYLLADKLESGDAQPILVSQVDLDILIRSKAAMYAILNTAASQVGIKLNDLANFYVAGTFGQVLDPQTAVTLGMLPDIPLDRFKVLGNSSLAGARQLLLEPQLRALVKEIAGRITYLELNVNQEFMQNFSAALVIPHTNASLFPRHPVI